MSIATIGDIGPAAAAVFYASDGIDLVFLSSPDSLHARHLATDPRVAVTIQDDVPSWSDIRGLQMLAVAEQLRESAQAQARSLYEAKFPDVAAASRAETAIAEAWRRVAWYRLAVGQLRFIDNSLGFGHSDEWTRSDFLGG